MGTADSIKVALGIGNCALERYCLVSTQVKDNKKNHCIVCYAQMTNAPLPGGGGTLGISGWGCAAGTLGPWNPGTLNLYQT